MGVRPRPPRATELCRLGREVPVVPAAARSNPEAPTRRERPPNRDWPLRSVQHTQTPEGEGALVSPLRPIRAPNASGPIPSFKPEEGQDKRELGGGASSQGRQCYACAQGGHFSRLVSFPSPRTVRPGLAGGQAGAVPSHNLGKLSAATCVRTPLLVGLEKVNNSRKSSHSSRVRERG